jgi:hypothetical protein
MKTSVFLTLGLMVLSSCASYNYAHKVKTISFDDNISKGQAVGPIRGEDCTWTVLGKQLGGAPTIDRAFINAKNGAGGLTAAGFGAVDKTDASKGIRYINNATTANEGFNAYLFGKQCLVVTGVGYR